MHRLLSVNKSDQCSEIWKIIGPCASIGFLVRIILLEVVQKGFSEVVHDSIALFYLRTKIYSLGKSPQNVMSCKSYKIWMDHWKAQ